MPNINLIDNQAICTQVTSVNNVTLANIAQIDNITKSASKPDGNTSLLSMGGFVNHSQEGGPVDIAIQPWSGIVEGKSEDGVYYFPTDPENWIERHQPIHVSISHPNRGFFKITITLMYLTPF